MIVGHIGGAGSPYEIQKSLRFRASASAYLSRTYASAGSTTTWTQSVWVKRGALSSGLHDIFRTHYSATYHIGLYFNANDALNFTQWTGSVAINMSTTQVFRDSSAWYHIVLAVDSTQATASNRVKLYVNGVQITSFNTATYPTQNSDTYMCSSTGWTHVIGKFYDFATTNYFDGYLSEINFIDGQALDPSYFGQVSAETGAWIPKKYTGTYGTNGFYLPFSDNTSATTLAYDKSGNGNNWTPNNISTTSGASYDSMTDVPTLTSATAANFAVLNPLGGVSSSYLPTNGNLRCYAANSSVNWTPLVATIALQSNFYAEISPSQLDTYWTLEFGITPKVDPTGNNSMGSTANGGVCLQQAYNSSGNTYVTKNSTSLFTFGGGNWSTSDTFMVAYEASTGKVYFGRNGTWYNSGDPASGTGFVTTIGTTITQYFAVGFGAGGFNANFGQRPFAYTPPAGFKALCTKNLPAPSILNPKKHFDVVKRTGTGANRTITGVGFNPALVWIKPRNVVDHHILTDYIRGTQKQLYSNLTLAEETETTGNLIGFTSDGYTLAGAAASVRGATNVLNDNYVDCLWKAGGAPVANNAGSIQSQVSANPQAGFSIVTYTGTGANATVGHGLGVAPKMVIVKQRNSAQSWAVYHANVGAANVLYLDLANAQAASAAWNSTTPTSTVFSVGTSAATNGNSNTFVAYCFAEIPGFSKIGSYTGNGSADGPFVWCGFRPRWIMFKKTNATSNWSILDTARDGFNVADNPLLPNTSGAETTSTSTSGAIADVLSNGFKLRGNSGDVNDSGATYIFIAFAEAPFQFANAR